MSNRLLLLSVLTAFLSCARMVAPGGGPADETPPEVVSVSPEPGAGFSDLEKMEILWSERLSSATAAVFLYPQVSFDLDTDGSTMTVELDSFPSSGTLVVHLPPEVADRRNNQSGLPLDLVYSSLDSLPEGSIAVSMTRQGGGSIADRTLSELYEDSVLVRRTTPDTSGIVRFRWLDPGSYRLICYEDPDRSFSWDPEQEAGADTTVSLTAYSESLFVETNLTVVDTVGPILTDITARDAHHIRMDFNEEVSYASFGEGDVAFADSLGENLEIFGYWLSGGYSSSSVILETSRMPDSRITAYVNGITDLMNNVSDADSLDFYGTDTLPRDSLRVISYYPAPGTRNADPAGPFRIAFNYWIHPDTLQRHLELLRVTDSTVIEGELEIVSGRSFEFYPHHQLIGEQQHRFELAPGLFTAWGDTLLDPFSWSFATLWGDEPGAVSGEVSGTGAPVITLRISRTGGGGDGSIRYADVRPGYYRIEDVPPGRYTVAAFVDSDGGGTWSAMEPYGTFPGVIMVRPGLETEDVDIEILP
ncbi:MAG: hypothetical protein GF388_01450 [Candidatus Aegiribacteria sp.]|nr:hypothetical protein [Candidatus Aegiribacteria sp.]MBD3294044.1 hypothetical protein [Candidatus Fermentibacteria bacterium]